MSSELWTPTHRVPASGAACWASPDGVLAALPQRLDPGLEVRVLERRGDWGQVECSNGWTTWVDGRVLEQLAATAPPPPPPPPPVAPAPPPAAPAAFRATHLVPAAGLAAYADHDGAQPAQAALDASLPVQVVERWGDWAQIACSNGWTAWVDGRLLLPAGAARAAPPVAPAAAAPHEAEPWSFPWAPGLGPFALGGAALVLISTALPWLGIAGFNANAWDLRLLNVLTLGNSGADSAIRLGVVLLGVLLIALPALLRRPIPVVRPLAGSLAMELAIMSGIYAFRFSPHLDLGIGVFAAFLGGLAVFGDRWLARRLVRTR